jgi:hypothetical protein
VGVEAALRVAEEVELEAAGLLALELRRDARVAVGEELVVVARQVRRTSTAAG